MTDWEGIVADHGPAVWRTVFRLLGNHADADECFQETFATAITLANQPSGPVRHWNALLTKIATSRAIDRLRQRIRRSSHEEPAHANLLPDRHLDSRPVDRAQQAEMSIRLRSALAHLPPKQADAFCLHCLEGWSYRDVAEHLETSTDDVGALLHRARAALKDKIASILSLDKEPGDRSRTRLQPPSPADEVTHEQ